MKDRILGALYGSLIGDALGSTYEMQSKNKDVFEFENGLSLLSQLDLDMLSVSDDMRKNLYVNMNVLMAYVDDYSQPTTQIPSVTFTKYLEWLYEKETEKKPWDMKQFHKQIHISNTRKFDMKHLSQLCSGSVATFWCCQYEKNCKMIMKPMYLYFDSAEKAYRHGENIGYNPYKNHNIITGILAVIIQMLFEGSNISASLNTALTYAKIGNDITSLEMKLLESVQMSQNSRSHQENIEHLSKCYQVEDALALALYCSLVADKNIELGVRLALLNKKNGVCVAVITGNIIGAQIGYEKMPQAWRDIIGEIL